MTVRVYLDNNATTRLAPEALAAMMPYLTDHYVNASSTAGEILGADRPIVEAKRELALLFGDESLADNFYLTSGASEANSWAVHVATAGHAPGHIVSTAIEHPSIMAALEAKQMAGWDISYAAPRPTGRIEADDIAALLRPDTRFVTAMLANNETGIVQPIEEIGSLVRRLSPHAIFHVDATQGVSRLALRLDGLFADVDLVSLSAHKFHGPKGIGALYAADDIALSPLIHGSQQEGRRGGTHDIASAAGLAAAARLARQRIGDMQRIAALRDRFEAELSARISGVRILGSDVLRLANTSCFSIENHRAEDLIEALTMRGIVVASGSACTSGAVAPSHVLTAMGLGFNEARSVLRASLSVETTAEQLALTLDELCDLVAVRVD